MFTSFRKLVQNTRMQAVNTTARTQTNSRTPRAGEACSDVAMDVSQTLQVDLLNTTTTTPNVAVPPKFRFSAAEARQMMVDMNLRSTKDLLKALLEPASTLARPPISQFHVGAVGITPVGDVYVGVNVEFPGMPLNNSIHAEQFLVANLKHHKEAELSIIAVNAAPCGHCRQFLSELQCADTVEFLFANNAKWSSYRLHELLPMRFKPQDLLGEDPPPLLLSPQNHPFKFSEEASASISKKSSNPLFENAAQLALQEAQESYCPYSNCPAGVAIITKDGKLYGGGYMESCAYNPSMQALQSAIVHAVIGGLPEYSQIEEVILAEGLVGQESSSGVDHARGVKFLLSSISPSAQLTCLRVVRVYPASA